MSEQPVCDRVITGLPLWLLREYLEELGATRRAKGWLQGDGWRARLTQIQDYQIGSLRVGQVRLEIDGSPDALARLQPTLEKKLLRGGG